MVTTEKIVFFKDQSSPKAVDYVSKVGNQLSIQVEATGAFEIQTLGKINEENEFKPVNLINSSTYAFAPKATASGIYIIDLSAYDFIRLNLVSVSGTVNVVGRVVSV